jgi:hypothetical protein
VSFLLIRPIYGFKTLSNAPRTISTNRKISLNILFELVVFRVCFVHLKLFLSPLAVPAGFRLPVPNAQFVDACDCSLVQLSCPFLLGVSNIYGLLFLSLSNHMMRSLERTQRDLEFDAPAQTSRLFLVEPQLEHSTQVPRK